MYLYFSFGIAISIYGNSREENIYYILFKVYYLNITYVFCSSFPLESPGIAMISTLLTCGPCPTLLFSQ